MDKENVAPTDNELLFRLKKEENSVICNNIDGVEGIILSEITQAQKNKCYMFSLICGSYIVALYENSDF